jgi:hypothetical protein
LVTWTLAVLWFGALVAWTLAANWFFCSAFGHWDASNAFGSRGLSLRQLFVLYKSLYIPKWIWPLRHHEA